MFNKQKNLPAEGDLLFEKKNPLFENPFSNLISFLITIGILASIINKGFSSIELVVWLIFPVPFLITILTIYYLVDGIRNGFYNETYKGYFFEDKLVFYRISKHINDYYTKGKKSEDIYQEVISIKDSIQKKESLIDNTDDNFVSDEDELDEFVEVERLKMELENYKEGLLVLKNQNYPHKIEVSLYDVKYFISEKEVIKMIMINQENENQLNLFYNELSLAKPYQKNKAAVVDFLNKRVNAIKKTSKTENLSFT